LAEKNGLTSQLEEANNEIEILKSKLQDLQENYEMKDLEVDDILSKLEAIVVESNQ
jgi:CII-binding regulator of phage lambda lysogenization HflD